MNKILSKIALSSMVILLAASCSKEGCTDPNASNYDANAGTTNI